MQQLVIEKISESLGIKIGDLTPSTAIRDIAKDSMDVVEIIAVLSNEFKMSIDSSALNSIETIQDIVDYVEKHQNSRPEAKSLESF